MLDQPMPCCSYNSSLGAWLCKRAATCLSFPCAPFPSDESANFSWEPLPFPPIFPAARSFFTASFAVYPYEKCETPVMTHCTVLPDCWPVSASLGSRAAPVTLRPVKSLFHGKKNSFSSSIMQLNFCSMSATVTGTSASSAMIFFLFTRGSCSLRSIYTRSLKTLGSSARSACSFLRAITTPLSSTLFSWCFALTLYSCTTAVPGTTYHEFSGPARMVIWPLPLPLKPLFAEKFLFAGAAGLTYTPWSRLLLEGDRNPRPGISALLWLPTPPPCCTS